MPTQRIAPRRVSGRLRNQAATKSKMEVPKRGTFRVLVYPQIDSPPITMLDENGNERQFSYFNKLPLELREEILALALPGPRIIEFFPLRTEESSCSITSNKSKCQSTITTPALLHVNQETRQFALKFYQPCFSDYIANKGSVFMNFATDTILLSFQDGASRFFWDNRLTKNVAYGMHYLKLVRNVAICAWQANNSIHVLRFFRGLERITIRELVASRQLVQHSTLQKAWAEDAKKKKGGVTNANLTIEHVPAVEMQARFRWDKKCRF